MEHVIAKMLQDFERGKMTRRQLIQSLAFAATAVSAATASAVAAPVTTAPMPSPMPAAPEGLGFQAVTVNHISYQVADYAKTRDFYSDLLGMKVSKDTGKECHLSFGESFLIPRNAPAGTPRIDHIAYTIDHWDKNAVEAELKRCGLQPKPDTENSFHVQDVNGFDLQISGREMKA